MLVRSTIQAVTQPTSSASAALAAANTSELIVVVTICRPLSTASKLPRPQVDVLGVGPAMVKLPWTRNRNGGTTSASRITISSVERIAVWRADRRDRRGAAAAMPASVSMRATSADVVTERGASPNRSWSASCRPEGRRTRGLFGAVGDGTPQHGRLRWRSMFGHRLSISQARPMLRSRASEFRPSGWKRGG